MEDEIDLKEIKEGIEKFLEENKLSVMAVKDDIFTATELGELYNIQAKGTAKGRKMNEILAEIGFLEENEDRDENTPKWELTEEGRKYAITPIKFIVSIVNENNNILIDLKKDQHKWLGTIRNEIEKYYKEEVTNGKKE